MLETPHGSEQRSELQAIVSKLSDAAMAGDIPGNMKLCERALSLVDRSENPTLWAWFHSQLASLWVEEQSGDQADNLEQAISHYHQALEVTTRVDSPEAWGVAQMNLGNLFRMRIHGEEADNLEQAIAHYQQALEVFTPQAFPPNWASVQVNLGGAFQGRIHGEKADNLEQALAHYQQALEVFTRQASPQMWARIKRDLGHVFGERILGEKAQNVEHAIAHYEQALEVFTLQASPRDWALLQLNLGTAFEERIRGEKADNLEQVIAHFQQVLEVFTRQDFPQQWASIQGNLGSAFHKRVRGETADNVEQAIAHSQQALEVFTRQDFPQQWARAQENLGYAFSERRRGERADNLEHAIECYEHALEVFTPQAFPQKWAQVQLILGNAFLMRSHGGKADNTDQAIECFNRAQEVFTRHSFPEEWAKAQGNLGCAFLGRVRGEEADNTEQAIECCNRALEVFKQEAFPLEWAMAQINLGRAYADRIREQRADNLEQAIKCYNRALKVLTRHAFPEEWAKTQGNLGNAFHERVRGVKADNLEHAIKHYQQTLEVFTPQAFPPEWASAQVNLGGALRERVLGEKADNLWQAFDHHLQALQVFTRDAFPRDWAMTQMNLGIDFVQRMSVETEGNLSPALAHFLLALEVFTPEAFPRQHRDLQFSLGNLHFESERWDEAHAAFSAAIKAGDLLLQAAYTEVGQRTEVGSAALLYAHDAWCLLKLNRPADALQQLEEGKARLLDEALALAEAQAMLLSESGREALRAARQAVRELEFEARLPPGTTGRQDERALADALRQARGHLSQLVSQLRQEHPDFMPLGLALPELLGLIPAGGAMVVPLVTSKGTAVFVLPQGTQAVDETHVLWLDSFTRETLDTLLRGPANSPQPSGWLGTYFEYCELRKDLEVRKRWYETIESTGQELWETVMMPVHARLQALGLEEGAPVLLIPQGGPGTLPLHAAWRPMEDGSRRYFLDDWTVTYAPGGYAMATSRRRLQEPQRHHRTLLAVINPTGDLPYAAAEGHAVAAMFPDARCLEGSLATSEQVIEQVHGCNYLHFSCHGLYDWKDVMQSYLALADKRLTLAQIIGRLELGTCRLVTLSACESGRIDLAQAPDEYLGLPAGFLQAGAPTVLSTLWSVDALSTWLLIERFYHHLEQRLTPAASLRKVQRWLRDLRVDELRQYLEELKPEVAGHIPTELRQRFDTAEPDRRPFERPFWWAAFTVSGA